MRKKTTNLFESMCSAKVDYVQHRKHEFFFDALGRSGDHALSHTHTLLTSRAHTLFLFSQNRLNNPSPLVETPDACLNQVMKAKLLTSIFSGTGFELS